MTLGMAIGLLSTITVMTAGERARQPLISMFATEPMTALAFIGIGIGIALLAWSHNLGPLFGALLGLCLIVWWLRAERSSIMLLNLSLTAGLALLLYAPNIPTAMMQMGAIRGQGFWLETPTIKDLTTVALQMPLGTFPSVFVRVLAAFIALAGLWAIDSAVGRNEASHAVRLTLLVMAVAPPLIIFIVSLIDRPLFLFRVLQPSQVPVIVMMAFAPFAVTRGRMLMTAITAIFALLFASAAPLRSDTSHGEDWRSIAMAIRDSASGGIIPTVVVMPAEAELPISYYGKRLNVDMRLLVVPDHYPVRGHGYSYPAGGGGSPRITAAMAPRLENSLKSTNRIWLVSRYTRLFDPAGVIDDLVLRNFPCELKKKDVARLLARRLADGSCPPN